MLRKLYQHEYPAEDVLGYVYAVLHAPAYRARYRDFLRIDFPRIRLPQTREPFDALSALGLTLVDAHLSRDLPRRGLAAWRGGKNRCVESISYNTANSTVAINHEARLAPVPQAVWDFHIGGYTVLHKYLKSRKGRLLSREEIDHVGAIADSLDLTIDQIALIDRAFIAAFPEFT